MSVGNISSVANATSPSIATSGAAARSATLDYHQFLRLLVAELKNQDPTKPTDPTQFMSQLASFSAVEQQVQTNSTLDALMAVQANTLIGKTVTSADGATSGAVVAVRTSTGGGAIALLRDGAAVSLGAGVTIGAP